MRFKDFDLKEVDESGDGGFTGYAATFDREPDSYGDVIAKGAFTETLESWRESGRPVPLLYGHNMDDPDYNIGVAELVEDERGLLARARFDPSPKAQRVRELVREGRLAKMSFAFDVVDEATVELDGGVKANELRRLDLYEVSVVLVPANQHAEILDAKSNGRKYGMTISKADGRELYEVLDAIDGIRDEADEAARRIRDLLEAVEEPPADDTGDNAGDEGDEEDPETGNSDAKSRASLIARLNRLIR